MKSSKQHPLAAFTLVELLVVIGIIALLVSILVPALNKARAAAQLAQCSSNLRQIMVAVGMYAHDNHDHFPDPGGTDTDPNSHVSLGLRVGTLANYNFRRALGQKDPADPSGYPEWMGLPSVLHGIKRTDFDAGTMSPAQVATAISAVLNKPRYLPGNSKVWICPAQYDFMKEFGNTYMWTDNDDAVRLGIGIKRNHLTFGKNPLQPFTTYMFDNDSSLPGTPGFRGPFTAGVFGLNKFLGSAYIKGTHKVGNRRAINNAYLDQSVGVSYLGQ